MTKQNLDDLCLSENFIFQIRNLIDGNQIYGNTLEKVTHKYL